MIRAASDPASKTFDFVQLRQVLEELCKKEESDALRDVVFGLLLKAEKVIEDQGVEIQQLRKRLFGRSSEKLSPNQLSLFAQMLETVIADDSQEPTQATTGSSEKGKKKRKGPKRRPLTPTATRKIPIPEEERPCPQCGEPRCTFDHDRMLVIEYTPPKIDVIEYLREKVVCRACEGEIQVAPPPYPLHERPLVK